MQIRRLVVLATLSLVAGLAAAAAPRPFTQGEFDTLTHDGKAVVVHVAAAWCPTCKAQKPIIESLSREDAFKDVAVLVVDFDADKPVLKEFKVGAQSTLIAFKGGKESARTIGDTTPSGIEALFRKSVQ